MDSGFNKDITTIKISKATKSRIENLRSYKRESYEEIMEKILSVLNLCRIAPESAQRKLILIDKERQRNLKINNKSEAKKDNYLEIKKNEKNIKINKPYNNVNKFIDKLRR